MENLEHLHSGLREYVEKLQKQLEIETDEEKRNRIEEEIRIICKTDEDDNISPKARVFIKELNNIDYKIDEFIDLLLHGEIRSVVENSKVSEIQKEELNRSYIETELVLERAMDEILRAIENINDIYNNCEK